MSSIFSEKPSWHAMQRCLKFLVAVRSTEQQVEKQCGQKDNNCDKVCRLHSEPYVLKFSAPTLAITNYRYNVYLRSAGCSGTAASVKEAGNLHTDAIANFLKPFWTAEQIDRADYMRGNQNGEKINQSHAKPFQCVKHRGLEMTRKVSNHSCCIAALP